MAPQNLSNLTVIIDYNKGRRPAEATSPWRSIEKWRAFGWDRTNEGHDIDEISALLSSSSDRPRAIIAHTVKGKGVSFMEDDNNWHYRIPSADEVDAAFSELGLS